MFSFCPNLEKVDFNSFNTENVEDMSYLFEGCKKLENINFSNLNTKNDITIEGIFSETNLINIDLSNLKVNNVKNFSYFFSECENLNTNHLSSLKCKNANDMKGCFEGWDLINVKFSKFNFEYFRYMDYCFSRCKNIEINENSSILNLRNCISMRHTFYKCDLLKVT